jgi:hypothetical protein
MQKQHAKRNLYPRYKSGIWHEVCIYKTDLNSQNVCKSGLQQSYARLLSAKQQEMTCYSTQTTKPVSQLSNKFSVVNETERFSAMFTRTRLWIHAGPNELSLHLTQAIMDTLYKINTKQKKKYCKAIPVTGRGGLWGCVLSRIPHCLGKRPDNIWWPTLSMLENKYE